MICAYLSKTAPPTKRGRGDTPSRIILQAGSRLLRISAREAASLMIDLEELVDCGEIPADDCRDEHRRRDAGNRGCHGKVEAS